MFRNARDNLKDNILALLANGYESAEGASLPHFMQLS